MKNAIKLSKYAGISWATLSAAIYLIMGINRTSYQILGN